jgi:hypothetical protein
MRKWISQSKIIYTERQNIGDCWHIKIIFSSLHNTITHQLQVKGTQIRTPFLSNTLIAPWWFKSRFSRAKTTTDPFIIPSTYSKELWFSEDTVFILYG